MQPVTDIYVALKDTNAQLVAHRSIAINILVSSMNVGSNIIHWH